MGLMNKITSLWKKEEKEPIKEEEYTPQSHSTEDVNEVDYLYRIMQVETNRRAIFRDVQNMLINDPLVDETNYRLARKAVRGGIFCIVNGSGKYQKQRALKTGVKAKRGSQVANRAQEIIDAFWKRCKIDSSSILWVSKLVADGDIFLNIVIEPYEDRYRIKAIRVSPPAIMKRNENEYGEFPDVQRAFSEIDPKDSLYYQTIIPDTAKKHFPLWAINHIRWKYRGGLYGTSQYVSIRKLSKQNLTADDDMVVRRKTRAPQRRVHSIGDKDKPGDPKDVEKYKAEHRDAIINGKYTPITDYFNNGRGDVKNLDGDGNLDKIGDAEYLYNKENIGTAIPKGLVGFAEDINRDVLDDQKEELYEIIEDIRTLLEYGDGGPFSGLRAIVELELLLHGIDVEMNDIKYDITFNALKNEPPKDLVERTIRAREARLIDQRTAVTQTAHLFNVEDPDTLLEALEEEAEQAKQQFNKNQNSRPKGGGHDVDDEEIEEEEDFKDADEMKHLKGMDKVEKKAMKIWKSRFDRLHKEIKKLIKDWELPMTDSENDLTDEEIDKFIEAVAKVMSEDEEEYTANLQYVYTTSGKIGGTLAATSLGISFDILKEDIFNDLISEAGKRIKNIDQTTLNEIREALADAELKRGNIKQMQKALSNVVDETFANAYHNRLEMIARTESMWAYNRSALRTYASEGIDTTNAPGIPAHPRCRCAYSSRNGKVIILVVGDERTCPVCRNFIDEEY